FQIEFGNYTITELALALSSGFNSAGGQEYEISVDRTTRKITISGENEFSILLGTGSNSGQSVLRTAGFTYGNKTGSDSYTATNAAVSQYVPQFKLQSYVPPDNYIQSV